MTRTAVLLMLLGLVGVTASALAGTSNLPCMVALAAGALLWANDPFSTTTSRRTIR